jgi:hypothetical protein
MPANDAGALVAWDVDDVLNDLTHQWASWSGVDLSEPHPPTGDSATWMSTFGLKQADYLASLDAFRLELYGSLDPNPMIQTLLENWPSPHETHIALTATPLFAQSIVAEWVMRHFGRWLRAVWFCPSQRLSDPPGTPVVSKGAVVGRFSGRAVLIDDSIVNLETVAEPAKALAYPRPWNSSHRDEGLANFVVNLHQACMPERDGIIRVYGR